MRKTKALFVLFLGLSVSAAYFSDEGEDPPMCSTPGILKLGGEDLRPDAPETLGQLGRAGLTTTCPANSKYLDVCIDSAMSVFTTAPPNEARIPASPSGAVGPRSLIGVTNVAIECIGKENGTSVFFTLLTDMFGSMVGDSALLGPRVLYDSHEGRFVLVTIGQTKGNGTVVDSSIFVAVSKSDNPLSATSSDWYMEKIPAFIDSEYADFASTAFDEEAIYVTTNMFGSGGLATILVWIIGKAGLYNGSPAQYNHYPFLGLTGTTGLRTNTHVPAIVRSSTGIPDNVGTYLLMYSGQPINGIQITQIIEIKNPLSSPTFRGALVPLAIPDLGPIEDAPQPGTTIKLRTNDRRTLSAVWVKNQLWLTTTAKNSALGNRTSVQWQKFNADGVTWPPTFVDYGAISVDDTSFTYYGSVDVNSRGVAAFAFSASSPTMYASAYATIRDDNVQEMGTTRPPDVIKAGLGPYNLRFDGTTNRWGDYSAISLDPSNENCFWAFNQFAGADNITESDGQFGSWYTAWAQLCYVSTPWPTMAPTKAPIHTPTQAPIIAPTKAPNKDPTRKPTRKPTPKPTIRCKKEGDKCFRSSRCCRPLMCGPKPRFRCVA